jgi:hypothetical protein
MGGSPSGGGSSKVEDAGERGIAGVRTVGGSSRGSAVGQLEARLRASAAGATVPGRGGGGKVERSLHRAASGGSLFSA